MPASEQATPPAGDPRAFMAKSKLAADPRLVTMWQGYAFAVEYNEPRGHAYMLLDQQLVKRVQPPFKQPGSCLNCHASVPEVLNAIDPKDPAGAWATMNKMPYADAAKLAKHPVTCIDCHDPATMKLRITRPAFVEGIKAYKATQGIANFDPNKDATNNEMRARVRPVPRRVLSRATPRPWSSRGRTASPPTTPSTTTTRSVSATSPVADRRQGAQGPAS